MTRAVLAAAALALSGCGFALAQTAKTLPPGSGNVAVGGGALVSQTDADRGGWSPRHDLSMELGGRYGVAENVDVGLTGYLGLGALLDAKWAFLDPSRREAIALRGALGAGANSSSMGDVTAQLGVLGSYDVTPWLTPYAGVVFANHWVFAPTPTEPLPAGTSYARRAGYGDGVLELHAGVALTAASRQRGAYVEYVLWLPMQDDPGDFYRFARTNVFELTGRF